MVKDSRLSVPVLAAVLAGSWPCAAAAAPRETAPRETREAAETQPGKPELAEGAPTAPDAPDFAPRRGRPAESYSTALTLAYVLAPLLAIPVGAGLFELTGNDASAVVGATLAVVAVPVTTHVFNGEPGRGAVSGLLLPLVTLGGVLVGGVLGVAVGSAGCDGDSDCELAGGIGGAVLGGLLGGVTGYVSYAIYDVSAHSSLDEPRAGGATLQLWARPLVGGQNEAATEPGPLRLGGALMGVALGY